MTRAGVAGHTRVLPDAWPARPSAPAPAPARAAPRTSARDQNPSLARVPPPAAPWPPLAYTGLAATCGRSPQRARAAPRPGPAAAVLSPGDAASARGPRKPPSGRGPSPRATAGRRAAPQGAGARNERLGRPPGPGAGRASRWTPEWSRARRGRRPPRRTETGGKNTVALKQGIAQDPASSPRLDKFKIARQLTDRAIKEKKIFSIYGHFPVVRAALRRKGWVEKFPVLPKGPLGAEDSGEGVPDHKCTEVKESQQVALEKAETIHDMMSRLVKNETPHLLWTIKRDAVDYHNLAGDQMLNHFGKTASFTTKIGLCLSMRSLPWYVQANPDSFFPRCYGLCTESEKQEFLDDFRRTAASSILKWVVSHQSCSSRSRAKARREEARDSDSGGRRDPELRGLSGQLVDAACRVCQAYLGQLEHEDIDVLDAAEELTEAEWQDLTQQYYSLVHDGAFICNSRNYLSQCQTLLRRIMSVSPQTEIDGLQNIWILKPAAKSRGRGITCMDRVEEILELVAAEQPPTKDSRWVIQKYIETPMLIHDTKFDIRQWFLVTDWNPLTVWFYKESYLRFCTQRFSLHNLDSAAHLCNNSIQRNLQNDSGRSPLLPGHNTWTSSRFQEYLQRKGRGAVWGSVIYPSMKRAISHAVRLAQDRVEARKNSFELYGADFILGSDFKPWLIEINSSPSMHPSTPVTAQLCAQVQEDTIKVVVDRKLDRNCDTGNFELLWKQPAVELPPFGGSDLCVQGVSVRKPRKQTLPIASFNFSAPLSHPRSSSALPGPARGPPRLAVQRGPRLKEEKVLSRLAQPGPLKRGCRKAGSTKAPAETELPACRCRPEDSKAPRSTLTEAPPTSHEDPNLCDRQPLAPALQSGDSTEGALCPSPRVTGPPSDLRAPCLVCQGPLPPARPCKRCRSFCASVLQGATFVPLGGGRDGPWTL
ncbi:protein monoglycylase TTLL8 isoform X2 [Oryctolagus cuniculus]|uniref:protein monoglycylase TTLL8 isoform X2 n=2 Tax=Oryctolagus cuniculus TaxID=9986 RepID=UPI003879C246